MRYYIIAPAGIESGGPELLHQLCRELLDMGKEAYMYYVVANQKEPVDTEPSDKYLKYNTSHVKNVNEVECTDSTIIFNESSTSFIPCFKKCRKILWWLSVDNYISSGYSVSIEKIKEEISFHLVQSWYAYEFVKKTVNIETEQIIYLSDYISESYGQFILPAEYRENMALFNPKKGYEDLKPLIEKTPWLEWIPLINLDEERMILLMEIAKVYVDFGAHPGKDRIPREAASCGCCVITNKKGSAAFWEDVPVLEAYKFSNVSSQYDKIADLLKDICADFKKHSINFDVYRQFIKEERKKFTNDVKNMLEIIDRN